MAPLIVSISGIRGIIGDGLGPQEAVRFALAFGTVLEGGTVILGRDSRPSGPMLADAIRAGLHATGCRVLDAGVLSTPGLSVLVRDKEAAGGMVITASHNPAPYNGIKLLSARGMALDQQEGRRVLDVLESEAFRQVPAPEVGSSETCPDAAEIHVGRVLETVDAGEIRAADFRVVVDPVNGAGGKEMRMLLERLGCRVAMIHGPPSGDFGRPPEPVPENLTALGEAVRAEGADVGFALDPDADRLSLVDETGRAVGEEYTLALACRHRLTCEKGPLAANLSTSRMIDDVAAEAGVPVVRTPVGEINVATAIEREACLIGGEGNGGVIDPRVTYVRDSLAGAALVLEMMAARGGDLSELVDDLPVYTMVKDKVTLGEAEPARVLEAARARFTDARVDDRDGLHFAWDGGWLHVRPSNTEPILRILAEDRDAAEARVRVEEVKRLAAEAG